MKIVFVCDTLGPGGAERVISILSNEFAKKRHSIYIVLLSRESKEPFYKLDDKIKLIYLTREFESNLGFFKKSRLLKKCIENTKADIVISFLSYVCIYTWWALRNTKIPYVVSERNDPHQRSKIKQYLLNLSFKKSAACVFQTEDALNWYKDIVKYKSTVIYNPVELSFIPTEIKTRKKQVLYVGRLDEQKNLFMLLDAFNYFSSNNPEYSLKIYGGGPLKEQLTNYINYNSLGGKVTILGNSNKWQQQEYNSSLFVLPSKFEGMPNVLAEALCLGIPSVSTDCPIGGPKELKKLFPNKLILSKNDSADCFAKAMEEGLKIKITDTRIPDELNSTSVANKWIDLLYKLVNNRSEICTTK